MIPYASSNLRIIDFFCALLLTSKSAERKIVGYFSKLTGKKYVLITNSCRAALFLTYKAINKKGEVITSPLTCRVAIDPIVESGNIPVFADINTGDLNIDPDDIVKKKSDNTIAIQAIHFGGVACDMEKIIAIAKENKLYVIEDCAQSLGATINGKAIGSRGDVACFSLIKNAYGIGGGILATNDKNIYKLAKRHNSALCMPSRFLLCYRVIRNLLDEKRNQKILALLYWLVMKLKGKKKDRTIKEQLFVVSPVEIKIAAHQLSRWNNLHGMRRRKGRIYYEQLVYQGLMINCQFDMYSASFTKFYVYHPAIDSKKHISMMNDLGIEAMHLEQKHGSPYQKRFEEITCSNLYNYGKVHDCLLSLPLSENISIQQQHIVVEKLKEICFGE